MSHLTEGEVFLFLYLAYCFASTIWQWPTFDTCKAPIQIFLITYEPVFFLLSFIGSPGYYVYDDTSSSRKLLNFLYDWILTPLCIYLAIQGIIWQIIDMTTSPECPTVVGFSFKVWFSIVWMSGFGALLIFVRINDLWWNYQFRRRERLNQQLLNRESNTLTQSLASNLVALLPGEIDKLERGVIPVTCPICLGDYEKNEEVVYLRKCQHDFHRECVTAWFRRTPLCPMCRGNVRNGLESDGQQSQNNAYRGVEDIENPQ